VLVAEFTVDPTASATDGTDTPSATIATPTTANSVEREWDISHLLRLGARVVTVIAG
jgi:hypothetical protein